MFRVFNCLGTQHDWRLVLVAAFVCLFASTTGVILFQRARALSGAARAGWLLTAGMATGSGVWATHFIAMLAFDPGFPFEFDIVLTVFSLLVAIAVTCVGFVFAMYGKPRWSAVAGGAVVGFGIACMHYIGIAALRMSGEIVWATDLVVVSIILGIVLAAAALETMTRGESTRITVAASGLLTMSIVAHHFTAMGAAGVVPGPLQSIEPGALSHTALSLVIAAVTASVLWMCMLGAWFDRNTRQKVEEQNKLLDGALNNMIQGLCMFDAQNRLLVWNERYRAMYNIDPKRIWYGCTIRDLLDARIAAGAFPLDPGGYDRELRASLKQGKRFTLNIELADGRTIAVINQPTESGGWVATHEDITERKKAERELEHTRSFLNTIIENVPSPIIVTYRRRSS